MDTLFKVALGAALALIVVGGVALLKPDTFSGQNYETDKKHFYGGLFAGSSDQFQVQNDGDIVSTSRPLLELLRNLDGNARQDGRFHNGND